MSIKVEKGSVLENKRSLFFTKYMESSAALNGLLVTN